MSPECAQCPLPFPAQGLPPGLPLGQERGRLPQMTQWLLPWTTDCVGGRGQGIWLAASCVSQWRGQALLWAKHGTVNVLVYLGCCSKNTIEWGCWWKKRVSSSQFWTLGSLRSTSWQNQCLVGAFFLVHGWCYGLNICVAPKLTCWDSNAHCDGSRRWGLWEIIRSWGRFPVNGNSAVIKKIP